MKEIKKINKYLKRTKPSGFAHGWQLSNLERLSKEAKKGKATKEELRDAVRTIKKLKSDKV